MLYRKKGQYHFQRRDTYWDGNLDSVILAWLKLLHRQLSEATSCGVPGYYCNLQAKVEGKGDDYKASPYSVNVDLDAAHQLRLNDLVELIYCFDNKNEPKIQDYDFTIEMAFEDKPLTENPLLHTMKFDIQGEDEHNRYNLDVNNWELRKKKGRELMGKLYAEGCLDW